jgi:Matrixin/Transposase DDE domain group 1
VNDAERLARDPVMRAIVGRGGMDRPAASTGQMGRLETEWLASEANLAVLTDLSGAWIDRVHVRRPPDGIILDMDSSESPTKWQAASSFTFRPITPATGTPDISLSFGSTSNAVGQDMYAKTDWVAHTITFDNTRTWLDSAECDRWGNVIKPDLLSISVHEIGHVLGLNDNDDSGSVMLRAYDCNKMKNVHNASIPQVDITNLEHGYLNLIRNLPSFLVDLLEAVEIEAEQRHRLALAPRRGRRLGETVAEQRPVWQTGERIVRRQMLEQRLGLTALGDLGLQAEIGRAERCSALGHLLLEALIRGAQGLLVTAERLQRGRRALQQHVEDADDGPELVGPPDGELEALRVHRILGHHLQPIAQETARNHGAVWPCALSCRPYRRPSNRPTAATIQTSCATGSRHSGPRR